MPLEDKIEWALFDWVSGKTIHNIPKSSVADCHTTNTATNLERHLLIVTILV